MVNGSILFAGTVGGIFFSVNNGTSWTIDNSGLANLNINSLGVSGGYIFAGTLNAGIWRRPLSEFSGIIDSRAQKTSNDRMLIIFSPRIAGSNVIVEVYLPHRERTAFSIYNITGHAVQMFSKRQFEPGPQTLSWDTKSWPLGCYLVKMQAGADTYTKIFTLIR